MAELYALQQVADTLKNLDATIVAITPQLAEDSRSLIQQQKISFDLLSDPGNAYSAQLGLRFTLPDDLKAVYLSFGIDLPVRNGEPSWTLPMPARFVVDCGGIVRAAMSTPITSGVLNRKRPSTTSMLWREAALTRLRSSTLGERLRSPNHPFGGECIL